MSPNITMQKNSAQQAIKTLQSVKIEYYQLGILNFTLFVAIFIKDLPIIYIIGAFILIRLVYGFATHSVLKICKLSDQNSPYMITSQVQNGLKDLTNQANQIIKGAGAIFNGENSINTIIYALIALYFSTNFLPSNLEAILFCNFLFIWVFMRESVPSMLNSVKNLPKVWKS